MRFDTPIYFQRISDGEYDPESGNYGGTSVSEQKRRASVTSTGRETLNLIYGEIRQDSLTIRTQTAYTEPFDRIRVGEKVYRVDFCRPLRTKCTYIVSEVQ